MKAGPADKRRVIFDQRYSGLSSANRQPDSSTIRPVPMETPGAPGVRDLRDRRRRDFSFRFFIPIFHFSSPCFHNPE
jgi:hypothetical protein